MKQFFFILMILLLLSACSGIKTTSDYDSSVNFHAFKTYEFYGWDKNTSEALNSLDRRRIEAAFAEEFKKRGLELVEKGEGDLIVSLFLTNDERKQTSTTRVYHPNVQVYMGYGGYYGFGPGWGYGPGWGGYTSSHTTTYNYKVGTLLCSVYDAQQKQLIWESAASKTIDENPEMRKKSIPYVVRAIMRKYPAK
ncbi:DUF4136 domain-containing protein [Carboxylicivirga taeanensis]|uniref:DUF4136 domain-containing protein n=1 Tax=Carboxylicivirga taeanensis TaxID=1416875 RepID=UPI003F6DC862